MSETARPIHLGLVDPLQDLPSLLNGRATSDYDPS